MKKENLEEAQDTKLQNGVETYLNTAKDIGFKVVLKEPFISDENVEDFFFILFHYDYSILLCFDTFTWGDDGSWKNGPPPPTVNGGSFFYNWSPNNSSSRGKYTSSGQYVCERDYYTHVKLFNKNMKEIYPTKRIVLIEKKGNKNVHLVSRKQLEDFYEKNHKTSRLIWVGDHDCRQNLRYNIDNLIKNGNFLKHWVEVPFLWLIHHGDGVDSNNNDYKEINEKRIKKLPIEIQKRITP